MNGAPWGGSEELWYRTALHLAAKGIKVGCAVYEWPQKETRLQKLEEAGCQVYRLPRRHKQKGALIKSLIQKLRYKRTFRKMVDAVPVQDYSTIVINQGGFEVYTDSWKYFYTKLNHYVLLFHNYNEEQRFSTRQKKLLKTWIGKAYKNLFAAGRMQSMLQQQLAIDINNGAVFINPITFEPPAEPRPFPSLVEGCYILSVFAALDVHRKAQDRLIQVLRAEKWKARSWQLHLYGEGKDKELLQRLINESGLQEKVFLKGHTASVVDAMEKTHLVLQLTNIDAMPLSVVEAMAVGRPLLVTHVGDMPAWVHQGENGWVCATDENAIDNCLEKAWENRERWQEMGQRSFHLFQQRFPRNVEERFLELMK